MEQHNLSWSRLTACVTLFLTPFVSYADDHIGNAYAGLSLEELMATRVTSVAGVEESLFDTPAALTVVTREDMLRAGHRSIPEALRLVPGTFVGRDDSNTWSIGTRGFSGGFGNKQLVLIDGRTTYDLLFSGTFWDVQDVMLEDLDRIEVVRGPGATLWGANAVNGVINITTRDAQQTQGLYVGGGSGSYERLFGEFRYGGRAGDSTWYRIWSKHFERDEYDLFNGAPGRDDWRMTRSGFRVDQERRDGLHLTVQGDVYDGDIGELVNGVEADGEASGHNILARLGSGEHASQGWTLQSYYDHTDRITAGGFVIERDTFDIDFRRFHDGEKHNVIWGFGYRYTDDMTAGTTGLIFSPSSRSAETLSGFIQDTITLQDDSLFLMLGSKFEHNDFSGFEMQPSVRLWHTPDERRTTWAAISRPVRTPSRTDEDLAIEIPGLFSFSGNPNLDAEELLAYEFGHRRQLTDELTVDFAAFYNDYDRLLATAGPQTALTFDNSASAGAAGFELATLWRPFSNWQLKASYSYLNVADDNEPVDEPDGGSPQHLAQLGSFSNLGERLRIDAVAYYASEIEADNIDAYVRLDAGITWQAFDGIELRLRGQNLLDPGHPEVGGNPLAEVPRAVYLELRLQP
ncbi:MAG: TonB-dependent receptor [Gammaproteobacteria bacterium]|nr:TonB-dependent receptor [Gammaproteobacteria bacterium]